MKRSNFTRLIQYWGLIFLIGFGGSLIVIDMLRSYADFNYRAIQMRADYTESQKQILKHEVERVVETIRYEKAQSETLTESKIKSRIYEAYAIARHIYNQNKRVKNADEIQKMILDAISPIRFEDGMGYYFISRLDGIAVLFPSNPELEGKNLLEVRDINGKYITKDVNSIVQQSGEGFYEYTWTKPGEKGNGFKKISFVKDLGIYNWFIGTGLYLEDVENEIKSDLLSTISRIRFGKEGYIFINRLNGDALVSNGELFSGDQKLWEIFSNNPDKMKGVFEQEYKAAMKPQGDFIYYFHVKLTDPAKESPKVSFIYGIPELQWLVGAGVYLDDVDNVIAGMQTELNNQIKKKMFYFTLISLGIVAFFYLLLSGMNRRLKKDFDLFDSFFKRAALSDEPIDRSQIQFEELDRMAGNANRMLADRRQAQNALKASEERYSTIYHEARDGIALIEVDTSRIVDCNPQFEEMTGKSQFDLQQMKIWEIGSPEDEDLLKEKFKAILRKKQGGVTEIELSKSDGTLVPIEIVAKQVAFDQKNLILAVARDLTERRQVEDTLQKMEKLKSVGTLAGGIAHDFNNILMGLFGNISLAKDDLPEEHPSFQSLEEAGKSMSRAIRLTKQLLTFSKGGSPITEITRLESLVKDVVQFDLSGSNVKPVYKSEDNLWSANVDKGQIQQVFSNLTVNARQAMPSGGHLVITMENVDITEDDTVQGLNQGKYIRVTLTDEGVGIERKHLGRIFDPYFTTKQTGTGLGLATVYSIITKHGGSISVDSQLTKGTCFTFYLPASEDQHLRESPQLEAKPADSKNITRILVMDDEKMIRKVVKAMLERCGYAVETAAGGKQVIEMYKQALNAGSPYDVVIMDLTIPGGMGGEEAIVKILEIDPKARVIVSSGYTNDPVMANYIDYGFCGIVSKPYIRSNLIETINQVLYQ